MKTDRDTVDDIVLYVKLKLSAMGYSLQFPEELAPGGGERDKKFIEISKLLIQDYREKSRLLSNRLNPADKRIQDFLDDYLKEFSNDISVRIPNKTFILDRPGLARITSLPYKGDSFKNEYVNSYRIKQGILNNPKRDKRTTKGSFHIVEGGPPVPYDKIEVPRVTFAHFINAAFSPPEGLTLFPFSVGAESPVNLLVSLLLRPVVCPEVKGVTKEKSMEIRFFAPGSLVSNLDFVESIFGNAGDPNLYENDAGLDIDHWTGHTGCIILAPQLLALRKKDIGLPSVNDATERQKRDGMFWEKEDELYNNGQPFKVTCRDQRGVAVTIIGDNYYGYSKKEIKTQISYSANLFGLCEEEHAGGALVFSRKSIQNSFVGDLFLKKLGNTYSFEKVKSRFGKLMDIKPENYGVDKKFPEIVYLPENAEIQIYEGSIKWNHEGKERRLPVSPHKYYIFPSGHKLKMKKHPFSSTWELVSTEPKGIVCHKPCTVSGGGKSEISKSLAYAIMYSPFYVKDIKEDFEAVDHILNYDYKSRWKDKSPRTKASRPLLDPGRSLGSVVKLLTPSGYHTDEYNSFLLAIPFQVKLLVLFVKMFFREDRHGSWRDHISVNKVNGREGHELFFDQRKITASYLRVGYDEDRSWCMNTLRPDFIPSYKIQLEDDITASVVLPSGRLENLDPDYSADKSVKFVKNCEKSFFQRPDDAIVKGYDVRAEADMATDNNFITNYEPLSGEDAKEIIDFAVEFDKYTDPIKGLIKSMPDNEDFRYFISPSHPRIVEGAPTKNPRYLEKSVETEKSLKHHLSEIGLRLNMDIPLDKPVLHPVRAVLPSRRNNPVDREAGIRPLSVFNPIHFQEIPELFMDFICSLTGKSPSTTGAGSEGALTKGPFNMLTATTDLNNALLSAILTGFDGFTSAAGFVGKKKFDHDISVLLPEIWCRLSVKDRDPKRLIEEGSLEKVDNFEYQGKTVVASRLGYRITEAFLFRYMNRIFDEPQVVFTEEVLKPELQDIDAFADGVNNIVEAQKKVAIQYFEDGSIDSAIPPLKILLNLMAYGTYEGMGVDDPSVRKMFVRGEVLKSDWYRERLLLKQRKDSERLESQIRYLEQFSNDEINAPAVSKLGIVERILSAREELKKVTSPLYIEELTGTIGADPLFTQQP